LLASYLKIPNFSHKKPNTNLTFNVTLQSLKAEHCAAHGQAWALNRKITPDVSGYIGI
jgi:hypothetical protein